MVEGFFGGAVPGSFALRGLEVLGIGEIPAFAGMARGGWRE